MKIDEQEKHRFTEMHKCTQKQFENHKKRWKEATRITNKKEEIQNS